MAFIVEDPKNSKDVEKGRPSKEDNTCDEKKHTQTQLQIEQMDFPIVVTSCNFLAIGRKTHAEFVVEPGQLSVAPGGATIAMNISIIIRACVTVVAGLSG